MLQIDLGTFARSLHEELQRRYETTRNAVAGYVESGQLLRDVGSAAREIIVERTAERHVGIFGRPFSPYSERYARWKARKLGYRGRPNLSLSGRMLGEIVLRLDSPLRGRLTFLTRRSAEIAVSHHDGYPPMPRRPFFGIRSGSVDAMRLREQLLHSFSLRLVTRGFR